MPHCLCSVDSWVVILSTPHWKDLVNARELVVSAWTLTWLHVMSPHEGSNERLEFLFPQDIGSGQIIATSHDLTPNGGLVREIPWNPLISGKSRLVKYYNLARLDIRLIRCCIAFRSMIASISITSLHIAIISQQIDCSWNPLVFVCFTWNSTDSYICGTIWARIVPGLEPRGQKR